MMSSPPIISLLSSESETPSPNKQQQQKLHSSSSSPEETFNSFDPPSGMGTIISKQRGLDTPDNVRTHRRPSSPSSSSAASSSAASSTLTTAEVKKKREKDYEFLVKHVLKTFNRIEKERKLENSTKIYAALLKNRREMKKINPSVGLLMNHRSEASSPLRNLGFSPSKSPNESIKYPPVHYKLPSAPVPESTFFDPNVASTSSGQIHSASSKRSVKKQMVHDLPYVSQLPHADFYVYTQRNILVGDEKVLHNIPYVDDDHATEKSQFLQDILASYGDRIHDEPKIYEYTLVRMVEELNALLVPITSGNISIASVSSSSSCVSNNNGTLRVSKRNAAKKWSSQSKKLLSDNVYTTDDNMSDHHESCDQPNINILVFEAISYYFPNDGSAKEIETKYYKLKESGSTPPKNGLPTCGSSSPETQQSPKAASTPSDADTQSKYFNHNIDGPEAQSVPREKSLHSYKTLFCRRCLMYDCFLHSAEADWDPENTFISGRKSFVKFNRNVKHEACSQSCYRNLSETDKSSSKRNQSSKIPASIESIIRAEWKSCPNNYCEITQVVFDPNITCQDIYFWCQKEYPNQAEDGINGLESSVLNGNHVLNGHKSCRGKRGRRDEKKSEKRKGDYNVWSKNTNKESAKVNYNYTPCVTHAGKPCDKECHCVSLGHFCEKFCLCSDDCSYRFPGCKCNAHCNTKACPCFAASRECDPDLCFNCGSGKIPEPTSCVNVSLQRMHKKHLLLAPSELGLEAGFGCFIANSCKKHDLISEYCGEMISQHEADKRGIVYDKKKHSFLFHLNNDYSIDATRYGNKIRFANHSINPNCFAKIMKVNGEHRIGIYAMRDIDAGEELFFDYKYGPNERIEFVPIETKKDKV